jgi:hypothetical protein
MDGNLDNLTLPNLNDITDIWEKLYYGNTAMVLDVFQDVEKNNFLLVSEGNYNFAIEVENPQDFKKGDKIHYKKQNGSRFITNNSSNTRNKMNLGFTAYQDADSDISLNKSIKLVEEIGQKSSLSTLEVTPDLTHPAIKEMRQCFSELYEVDPLAGMSCIIDPRGIGNKLFKANEKKLTSLKDFQSYLKYMSQSQMSPMNIETQDSNIITFESSFLGGPLALTAMSGGHFYPNKNLKKDKLDLMILMHEQAHRFQTPFLRKILIDNQDKENSSVPKDIHNNVTIFENFADTLSVMLGLKTQAITIQDAKTLMLMRSSRQLFKPSDEYHTGFLLNALINRYDSLNLEKRSAYEIAQECAILSINISSIVKNAIVDATSEFNKKYNQTNMSPFIKKLDDRVEILSKRNKLLFFYERGYDAQVNEFSNLVQDKLKDITFTLFDQEIDMTTEVVDFIDDSLSRLREDTLNVKHNSLDLHNKIQRDTKQYIFDAKKNETNNCLKYLEHSIKNIPNKNIKRSMSNILNNFSEIIHSEISHDKRKKRHLAIVNDTKRSKALAITDNLLKNNSYVKNMFFLREYYERKKNILENENGLAQKNKEDIKNDIINDQVQDLLIKTLLCHTMVRDSEGTNSDELKQIAHYNNLLKDGLVSSQEATYIKLINLIEDNIAKNENKTIESEDSKVLHN